MCKSCKSQEFTSCCVTLLKNNTLLSIFFVFKNVFCKCYISCSRADDLNSIWHSVLRKTPIRSRRVNKHVRRHTITRRRPKINGRIGDTVRKNENFTISKKKKKSVKTIYSKLALDKMISRTFVKYREREFLKFSHCVYGWIEGKIFIAIDINAVS